MERRKFIKNVGLTAGLLTASSVFPEMGEANEPVGFDLLDLHVHTTDQFTIEDILEIGRKNQVRFGIVEHPVSWALKDDKDLKNYIDKLRKYPVYIGLQPTYLGWRKNYSEELLAQVDYILMDPQMVPQGNGETWRIWEFDTYIDDTEDFMKRYMDYSMEVLTKEPIDIFGWPLFLPVCIAPDYYKLWDRRTDEPNHLCRQSAQYRH
jgi:hypothetical protein